MSTLLLGNFNVHLCLPIQPRLFSLLGKPAIDARDKFLHISSYVIKMPCLSMTTLKEMLIGRINCGYSSVNRRPIDFYAEFGHLISLAPVRLG